MTSTSFTPRAQLGLIVALLIIIVGIGQPFSFLVYQLAMVLMMVIGLLQVAVGNVPPNAPPKRFFRYVLIFLFVMAALFAGSVLVTPFLTGLGR